MGPWQAKQLPAPLNTARPLSTSACLTGGHSPAAPAGVAVGAGAALVSARAAPIIGMDPIPPPIMPRGVALPARGDDPAAVPDVDAPPAEPAEGREQPAMNAANTRLRALRNPLPPKRTAAAARRALPILPFGMCPAPRSVSKSWIDTSQRDDRVEHGYLNERAPVGHIPHLETACEARHCAPAVCETREQLHQVLPHDRIRRLDCGIDRASSIRREAIRVSPRDLLQRVRGAQGRERPARAKCRHQFREERAIAEYTRDDTANPGDRATITDVEKLFDGGCGRGHRR